jgi:hypothetical protein
MRMAKLWYLQVEEGIEGIPACLCHGHSCGMLLWMPVLYKHNSLPIIGPVIYEQNTSSKSIHVKTLLYFNISALTKAALYAADCQIQFFNHMPDMCQDKSWVNVPPGDDVCLEAWRQGSRDPLVK